MVGEEKKEGREWLEKDTLALLLPERRAYPTTFFSGSLTSNHLNIDYYIK
jgi:hypothetical protein